MCGIAGIVSLSCRSAPPSREALMRMAGALAHRGPDERGLYRDDARARARAPVDHRPFERPAAARERGGTPWIVFNGEIFNYVELRAELMALGHRFRTRSDTEVIVHAYGPGARPPSSASTASGRSRSGTR